MNKKEPYQRMRSHGDLDYIVCQIAGYPLSTIDGITVADLVDMRARKALVSELFMLSSLSQSEIETLIPERLSEIKTNIYKAIEENDRINILIH